MAEKAGLSLSQVQRCLKQLEKHGYISKEKKGRSNVYTLREKIQIEDGTGRPAAVATWDYLPSSVQQAGEAATGLRPRGGRQRPPTTGCRVHHRCH